MRRAQSRSGNERWTTGGARRGRPPSAPRRRLRTAAPGGPGHARGRRVGGWADPARLHAEGRTARALLDRAREVIAAGLGVRPRGGELPAQRPDRARAGRRRGPVCRPAPWRSHRRLRGRALRGARAGPGPRRTAPTTRRLLAEVPVDVWAALDLGAWEQALAGPGTVVAALQSANGEVGTRQPLEAARSAAAAHGIPLVVDAMASLGRESVPDAWDVLVGDARSWGGPPLGVLVVREGVRWQWSGARADVEHGRTDVSPWVPLALAAAEAWQQARATMVADAALTRSLVGPSVTAAARVPDTVVVGDPDDRLPHVVTFSSLYVDGEAVVGALDRQRVSPSRADPRARRARSSRATCSRRWVC